MTDTSHRDRPSLGDFTRPSTKKPGDSIPEKEKVPVAPRPKAKVDDAPPPAEMTPPETREEKEAQERMSFYQEMQTAMLPVEDYKAHLEKYDISEEKASRIVDDLLTKGYYEEDFPLSRRVSVRLRTREQRDAVRMTTAMQIQRPLFQDAADELMTRYNLAASFAAYNGEEYGFPGEDASQEEVDELFDKRLRAVERLPSPVFSTVAIRLAKFDRMIMAVMREGVAENF